MKNVFVVVVFFMTTLSFAQNKNAKATLEVDGVCMMCKDRIEKAAIKSKGVKSAIWSVDTHELKLIFDERKTNLEAIEKSVASVGHDTKNVKADDDVYNNINPCCKYRDEQVVKDHQD
ncbi:heavy-metal-associated domain-containing protein [Corallibacter sp.]|uniref:heavy-metal-associated domain-containing protein n=1 Tax=Corallibacter sp. TaxID=2038084 RepID=UPI003A92B76E